MREMILNSLLCRCWLALLQTWRNWWSYSLIARMIASLGSAYANSAVYQRWIAWGTKNDYIENSRYQRIVVGFSRGLEWLGRQLSQSIFYRLMLSIGHGWNYLCTRSRILSFISRISLHQWLLVAFAFYLPLEFLIRDTFTVPILSSVWEELFLLIAAAMIVWRHALNQTEAGQRSTTLDIWLLLFFAVGFFLMSVNQPNPAVAFAGYRIVVEYMLWFFIIIRLIENDKDVKVFISSMLFMASLLTLHSIYQYLIGVEIPSSWTTSSELGVKTRVFSLTGSPNILGSLLMMIAPIMAALIYFLKKSWQKVLVAAILGCFIVAILFTFSKGAWVGLVVAIIIFAIFVDKRLLALMTTAIAAILVFFPSVTNRLTFLFTEEYAVASAIGGRTLRWAVGQELLLESNPWLGFGLGRFGGAVAMNNPLLDETETFQYFYMDNYYLKTLVEMGIVGFIGYIILIAALLILGIKAIGRSGEVFSGRGAEPLISAIGNYRVIAAGIYAGLAGVLTHCYFENIFEEPYMTAYFWGLAAVLMYLGFFRKKNKANSP